MRSSRHFQYISILESTSLEKVIVLRRRVDHLVALLRLMVLPVKLSGFAIDRVRLPEGAARVVASRSISN